LHHRQRCTAPAITAFEILGTDGSAIVHPESNPPRLRIAMRKGQGGYRTGWQDIPLKPQPRFCG
jgi:hypothetical protein